MAAPPPTADPAPERDLRTRDRIDTRADGLAWLFGRIDYERRPALRPELDFPPHRVRRLLAELGDPQDRIPAVHVAGTKGKGSTAAMLAAALAAAGHRVGLFTSPHLERFEERFRVLCSRSGAVNTGRDVATSRLWEDSTATADEFVALVRHVARAAGRVEAGTGSAPTYFELATAIGWTHFERRAVDIAVLEVGLGGRLDATNVCRPLVCAVTNVSRDHTALLGRDPAAIAREKAGIAKPGVPLVWGGGPGPAEDAVRAACAAAGAPFLAAEPPDRLFRPGSDGNTLTADGWGELPRPPGGVHQTANLAVALAVLAELGLRGPGRAGGRFRVEPAHVRTALTGLHLPGRIERVSDRPTVLLDTAHNWASAGALAAHLADRDERGRRVLLFAASREKDVAGLLRRLLPCFDTVVLTAFAENPRAVPVGELRRLAAGLSDAPLRTAPDVPAAWRLARGSCGPDDLLVAAGSFFLIAELRPLVRDLDPQSSPD